MRDKYVVSGPVIKRLLFPTCCLLMAVWFFPVQIYRRHCISSSVCYYMRGQQSRKSNFMFGTQCGWSSEKWHCSSTGGTSCGVSWKVSWITNNSWQEEEINFQEDKWEFNFTFREGKLLSKDGKTSFGKGGGTSNSLVLYGAISQGGDVKGIH